MRRNVSHYLGGQHVPECQLHFTTFNQQKHFPWGHLVVMQRDGIGVQHDSESGVNMVRNLKVRLELSQLYL